MDTVSVTGGPVDADTGATLNNMVADIEFDVSDTRSEIVENTASLDEANSVVVTGTAAADALNNAEYQGLLSEMTGDGSNITGHIDLVSVKPVISSFIVDTGDSKSDLLTNVNEVTLTVMAEKSALLKVFIDGNEVSVISQTATGNAGAAFTETSKGYENAVDEYTVKVATDFAASNDAKSFTVKAVDPVGNESVASDEKVITFDQTPPSLTVSSAGVSDEITDDAKTISGTTEANRPVELFTQDGTQLTSTVSDSSGNWSVTLTNNVQNSDIFKLGNGKV